MKKIFAVVVCCALIVSNVSAQDVSSVVEATPSDVVLTSAQEPAPEAQKSATDVATPATQQVVEAPATYVAQDPAAVEITAAPTVDTAPMVSGAPVVSGSGCGCGSGVVTNYAAPMASAQNTNCCCQPAADPCCSSNQNRGFRGFRARMASRRTRGNDCCCN